MIRRCLITVVLAAACGPHRATSSAGERRPARDAGADAQPITDDWSSVREVNQAASTLLVRGEQLARTTASGLVFVDAATLSSVDGNSVSYRSACILPGGRLAALSNDGERCELDVFDGTHIAIAHEVRACGWPLGARVLAGGPGELFVRVAESRLASYRIDAGQLVEVGGIELLAGTDASSAQMFGAGDGSVIGLHPTRRGLVVYRPGQAPAYRATELAPVHVAPGAGGRTWYSGRERGARQAQAIVLARPDGTTEARVSVAPGEVVQLAAGERGDAAALVRTAGSDAFVFSIVLLDEHGRERGRIAIAADAVRRLGSDLHRGFVALTPTRVVLAAGTHPLVGWDRPYE